MIFGEEFRKDCLWFGFPVLMSLLLLLIYLSLFESQVMSNYQCRDITYGFYLSSCSCWYLLLHYFGLIIIVTKCRQQLFRKKELYCFIIIILWGRTNTGKLSSRMSYSREFTYGYQNLNIIFLRILYIVANIVIHIIQ